MSPKISVIMATYNHAPYVAQTIRSVLDQTFTDFEFLIVDDGSDDDTPRIVEQFSDSRIRFWASAENRGSGARRNELIERASGEYVAVQNSDDYWPLDKLAHQFEFLQQNPNYAAVFGDAMYVDCNGAPLWRETKSPFAEPNRSRALWLRQFSMGRHSLCHSTVMLRTSCHDTVGCYDNRLRQRPDFDMWIRLVKRYELFVSDRIGVFLRWHGKNVSNTNPPDAHARWLNEQYLIATSFFDGVSRDLLVEGFADLLVFKNPPTEEHCDIEKALFHLNSRSAVSAVNRVPSVCSGCTICWPARATSRSLQRITGSITLRFTACRPRRRPSARPSVPQLLLN